MQTAQGTPTDVGPRYARDRELTLRQALGYWLRETPPRALLVASGVVIATRFVWGDWSRADLIPLVALPVMQPFVEWLIHVYVLHHKPGKVDFHAAQHHRAHHRDPWDIRFTVMPIPALAAGGSSVAISGLLFLPTIGSAISAMAIAAIMATLYEWTHFLIHTSYRPRTRLYRRLWRLHRLHHFKNEHYWMGVTRHFADWCFGTLRDKDDVPSRDTARTLGLDRDPSL